MKPFLEKATQGMKKYKYVALVLLLGIALLMLPESKEKKPETKQVQSDDASYAQSMQERLAQMLTQIEGAGRVEVMLSLAYGTRTEYQSDIHRDVDGERTNEEHKTVILSEGSAYDKAAVSAVRYPQFQGAVVVCQGADRPSVRLDIIHAVSALTGLGSDRITVVKMN